MLSCFRSILTFFLLVIGTVFAQNSTGEIVNTAKEGLPGALIQVIETKESVFSDNNGKFTLKTQSKTGRTLRVSLVGFITQEVKKSSSPIRITLIEDVKQLQETVVYGKTETAAAKEMSIKAEVLDMKQSYSLPVNISELMNRSSGIRIRQTGGLGSATDVSLNGFQGKSIRYFRDGIPMDYLGDGFSLSSLPVNMLERVEIYKGVLPVNLGSDALGGAVNLISRKRIKNYADVSYEIGSFNTHRINLNTNFIKNKMFYGVDAFYNYSDNDYTVTVKVTDPDTRNQKDADLRLFHNGFRGYLVSTFWGVKDVAWADEFKIEVSQFGINREQQHPAFMTDPYGAVIAKQNSLVPSLNYKKEFNRFTLEQFLAYNTLTLNRIDTIRGSFDWYGNFFPNPSKIGESRQASLSDIKTKYFTSRTNLKYALNAANSLEANVSFTDVNRKGNDPYGSKFAETNLDVLTLPSAYQKMVAGIGLNSKFGKFENNLVAKFLQYRASGVETFQAREISITEKQSHSGTAFGLVNGIKYNLSPNDFLRLSGEFSNRLPDYTELFGDNVWIVQNFSLKPEKSVNLNLGWRRNILNKYSFELSGFYRNTQNLILLVPIQAPYARYQNQENVRGFGLEVDGSVKFLNNFTANINATYQNLRLFGIPEGQDAWKNDARLRNTPYMFGNVGLTYKSTALNKNGVTLTAFSYYSYLHEFYLETLPKHSEGKGLFSKARINSELIVPSQHLVNAGLLLNLPKNRFSVGLDVKNLLNYALFDNYRIQRAGRSLHLKINYSII